jgi:hypothetical protein
MVAHHFIARAINKNLHKILKVLIAVKLVDRIS